METPHQFVEADSKSTPPKAPSAAGALPCGESFERRKVEKAPGKLGVVFIYVFIYIYTYITTIYVSMYIYIER